MGKHFKIKTDKPPLKPQENKGGFVRVSSDDIKANRIPSYPLIIR